MCVLGGGGETLTRWMTILHVALKKQCDEHVFFNPDTFAGHTPSQRLLSYTGRRRAKWPTRLHLS